MGHKIEIVARNTVLGESPHYRPETNDVLFVDIMDPSLLRLDCASGKTFKLPIADAVDNHVSFILPVEGQKGKYVVGSASKILLIEWDGVSSTFQSLQVILDISEKYPSNTWNDAKCDPQGRIWLGTISWNDAKTNMEGERGILCSLDLDGKLTVHVDKVKLSNGLGWSKDGSKFYHADSLKYSVDVFDFHGDTGTLSNRRVLFDMQQANIPGMPDGLCLDTDDNIYVASYGGARVLHLDGRTGAILDTIDFTGRASNITCAAFGGPNLDELFVTSATFGLKPEQLQSGQERDAGTVFKVTNLGTKGLAPGNYRGTNFVSNL